MKISKLFHWLYFIVMMLPIFSVPIFAIYSHRHTIDNYSVTRNEVSHVDYNFSQLVENGKPYNLDFYTSDGTISLNNQRLQIHFPNNLDEVSVDYSNSFEFTSSHDYFIKFTTFGSDIDGYTLIFGTFNDYFVYENIALLDDVSQVHTFIFNSPDDYTDDGFYFIFSGDGLSFLYLYDFQVFDLTSIFGSGNEPSLVECENIFVQSYYDHGVTYTYSKPITVSVTYNDTDIGSQFIYSSYNVVDKYFNYDSVFNFGALYDWLQLTFFNGNASLGFFIFWHLLIYWLLTSLIWLLFDVLIYVPMLVHRWLDKASIS